MVPIEPLEPLVLQLLNLFQKYHGTNRTTWATSTAAIQLISKMTWYQQNPWSHQYCSFSAYFKNNMVALQLFSLFQKYHGNNRTTGIARTTAFELISVAPRYQWNRSSHQFCGFEAYFRNTMVPIEPLEPPVLQLFSLFQKWHGTNRTPGAASTAAFQLI